MRSSADARLQVAKDRSAALIKEGAAEAKNSGSMEGMRRHKEKCASADVLT